MADDDDILQRFDAAFSKNGHRHRSGTPGLLGLFATTVNMTDISWLWPGRLAKGMLSGLDGDPELGKSQLVAYEAAVISRGLDWFDGHPCESGGVVLVSGEDPLSSVLVPRLVAAGADLERVLTCSTVPDYDGRERLLALPDDIQILKEAIERAQARLLVFDPITSYLQLDLNANADKDVRQALTPLAEMLDGEGCCGQMLRHLSKNDKVSTALYRGLGSIAFTAMARTSMTVAKDKENRGQFILAMTKSNVGAKPKARRYSIEGVDLGAGIETSRILFGEETDHEADELITAFGAYEKKQRSAKEVLLGLLADGPRDSKECIEAAVSEAGISRDTVFRYKKQLGIKARKKGYEGGWEWFIEESDESGENESVELEESDLRARIHTLSDSSTLPKGSSGSSKSGRVRQGVYSRVDPTLRQEGCTLRPETGGCAKHLHTLDADGRCPVSGQLVKEEE